MTIPKRKAKRSIWSIETIYCEQLEEGVLLATAVFRDSQFGMALRKSFKTGDLVRVTVEIAPIPSKRSKKR